MGNILYTFKKASVSEDGKYRWWLKRSWSEGYYTCCFIMLNPSTADGINDDPTIRRCVGFAHSWGCKRLVVVNLFAYRATDPRHLLLAHNPVGGAIAEVNLRAACIQANMLVAAWGAYIPFFATRPTRDQQVMAMIKEDFPEKELVCLGTTKNGNPRHPLYVKSSQPLIPYP